MFASVIDLVCLTHYWQGVGAGVVWASLFWITLSSLLLWSSKK